MLIISVGVFSMAVEKLLSVLREIREELKTISVKLGEE
jgi:hypothetical protein